MMAPGMLYGSGATNLDGVMFQRKRDTKEHVASLFVPASSASFLGSSSMVSFGGVSGRKKDRSYFDAFNQEGDTDEFGEYFHQAEKKKRLSENQLQFLEKRFEEDNKLEPERKGQLAKELELQPRQIAIWFQNRRARWKTKQLEKDYDALRSRYDTLKSDYSNLFKEKENLRAQVLQLNDKLLLKEEENGQLAKFDIQKHSDALPKENIAYPISRVEMSIVSAAVGNQQQEDFSSTKSDVFDEESSRYTDGLHSAFIDNGDSACVFEREQSDLSQEDDENFSKSMLSTANLLAKAEVGDYPATSLNLSFFGFPVEDDQGLGFWSY